MAWGRGSCKMRPMCVYFGKNALFLDTADVSFWKKQQRECAKWTTNDRRHTERQRHNIITKAHCFTMESTQAWTQAAEIENECGTWTNPCKESERDRLSQRCFHKIVSCVLDKSICCNRSTRFIFNYISHLGADRFEVAFIGLEAISLTYCVEHFLNMTFLLITIR